MSERKKRGITVLFNIFYEKINKKVGIIILLILYILGQIFNIFSPHKLFQVNQLMLLAMLIIQINVIRELKKEKEQIKRCLMEKPEPVVLSLFISKAENTFSTFESDIISAIFVIFYIVTMFAVGCLETSVTGFYGGLLGGLVFYIGIQAYFCYISFLYFTYNLRYIQIKEYSFYFPALTNWIRKLAQGFSFIEKWFLILGLMYSVIYAINLPDNTVQLKHSILINSNHSTLLIVTWIGILIFFAIAFPVFTFMSRIFIKNVVYNCKCNSINKIEVQLSALSNQSSKEDLIMIEQLISLTKTISESDEYPLKYSQTVFDKVYIIFISIITLVSPFLSIAEEIIFKR